MCVVLDNCALIAGHLHARTGLAIKAISVLISVVLIGAGIVWRFDRGKAESQTPVSPTTFQNQASTPSASFPPVRIEQPSKSEGLKAHVPRIVVSSFNLYLPSQTQDGVLLARVHYDDLGTTPITASTSGLAMRSEPRMLTIDEQQEGMRHAREAADKGEVSESELYPNDPHNFADIPDKTFFTSSSGREQKFMEGTYYVYVFVVFKYRDSETKPGMIGVTEWCGWLSRTTAFYHQCLVPNRTRTESGRLR